MTKRKKYDFDLLQKYCSENNVVLLEDYSNQNIVCHFVIEGKCSNKDCSNNFKKNLYKLINKNFETNIISLDKIKYINENISSCYFTNNDKLCIIIKK